MIDLEIVSKETRAVTTLKEWEANPRDILEADLVRLEGQLSYTENELFKPLVVMEDGTVLGGNQRLKVLRKMGVKKVWVKVVYPKNEEEKVKYAMSDNGRAGAYEPEGLRAQVKLAGFDDSLKALFKADTSIPLDIPAFLEKKADDTLGKNMEEDKDTTKEKLDTYQNGDQKQVVLFFMENDRTRIEGLFEKRKQEMELESNSEVILGLISDYA